MAKPKRFCKTWKFTFGQYEGRTIHSVAREDLEYVNWCLDHISWFCKMVLAAKEDAWVKKLLWCIRTERKNYNEAVEAWCWGGGRFPRFGQRTTGLLIEKGPNEDEEEPDYAEPVFQ